VSGCSAQHHPNAQLHLLGQTLDGRGLHMLQVWEDDAVCLLLCSCVLGCTCMTSHLICCTATILRAAATLQQLLLLLLQIMQHITKYAASMHVQASDLLPIKSPMASHVSCVAYIQ
jgi:hypothetical protein